MEKLNLRKYRLEDESNCLELVSTCYRDNGPRRKMSDLSIVIAEIGSKIIGFAGLERSELHDKVVVEYICVDSSYRMNGFGVRLHRYLLESYPLRGEEILDISCYADQVVEQVFIEKVGFKKYLNCYLNLYDPKLIAPINTEYEVSSLSKFYKNENAKELVKKFHIERYNQEHSEHLPVSEAEDVWEDYFDDGDSELGLVLHDSEKIYGTSFGYLDFGSEIHEVDKNIICFNGYAIGESLEDEAHNLMTLYSHQCELVKERDVQVYTEVDSTERVSTYIQDFLPECSKIYQRYQLKK